MMVNRSIPRSTVIPELPYPDIGQAIDWLCDAFGFTLRLRIADHRAQLNVGDGAVALIEADPKTPSRCSVLVRVEALDAHHERALRNGARIVRGIGGLSPSQSPTSIRRIGAERPDGSESPGILGNFSADFA
jgi:hypothetical protein